mmetsp:Transcript_98782/g.247606  ORF Transcript_98782/g.247606 Transcript_98782/m.247606 type:complete len:236 (+) Transcript_98782:101-808(+)
MALESSTEPQLEARPISNVGSGPSVLDEFFEPVSNVERVPPPWGGSGSTSMGCPDLFETHYGISAEVGGKRFSDAELPDHQGNSEVCPAVGLPLPVALLSPDPPAEEGDQPAIIEPRSSLELSSSSTVQVQMAHDASSIGSLSHAQGTCKPCYFFINNACKKEQGCSHCHMPHTATTWKRQRAPKHVRSKLREVLAPASGCSAGEAGREVVTTGNSDPAVPQLAGHLAEEQHTHL